MNPKNYWEIFKTSLYKYYGQDSGSMILHVGALGWLFSSVAQVFGVIANDKYTLEEKKFLIPQEIADGVVNVASFYLVTKAFKDVGQKLVKTGKWRNSEITKFVTDYKEDGKLNKITTNLEETFKQKFGKNSDELEEFYKVYSPFKSGVDMITTTIGSVISCNLLTPYFRNQIGANRQKKSIEAARMQNEIIAPTTPILMSQNKFGIDDYKKQASLNISRTASSGMKI